MHGLGVAILTACLWAGSGHAQAQGHAEHRGHSGEEDAEAEGHGEHVHAPDGTDAHSPSHDAPDESGANAEDPKTAPAERGAQEHAPSGHVGSDHGRMAEAMRGPLGIPLQQNGSGTGWQPASTPMLGHMYLAGPVSFMLHYNLFAGVDIQGSARGATQFFSTNWAMAMAQLPLLGGRLTARVMLSLEAPLMGPRGYPLLLQTGETADGQALVDRQHPHDLFMELALRYAHALSDDLAVEVYLAAAGEPALGPVAFAHRFSAYDDPLAPLSHHWQDSTHISFGVITGALYTRFLKLEVSAFNGHEPDENRYDVELRAPDSYSFRVSVNPSSDWSAQVSYGFLREPEALEPGESVQRITASVTYNLRLAEGNWANTLVFGLNRPSHAAPGGSVLLESALWLHNDSFFVRAEYVKKSALDFAEPGGAAVPLGTVGVGYVRHFPSPGGLVPGVGIRLAMSAVGGPPAASYGAAPMGFVVFFQLRPTEMMRHTR